MFCNVVRQFSWLLPASDRFLSSIWKDSPLHLNLACPLAGRACLHPPQRHFDLCTFHSSPDLSRPTIMVPANSSPASELAVYLNPALCANHHNTADGLAQCMNSAGNACSGCQLVQV